VDCLNHPGVEADTRCHACAESFCSNCIIMIDGLPYCGSCKIMAVKQKPEIAFTQQMPCKEAQDALTMAIVGIFCFGIILGPMAISKAVKAQQMINANPNLTGSGKATAAIVLGIIVTLLSVLGIISMVAQ